MRLDSTNPSYQKADEAYKAALLKDGYFSKADEMIGSSCYAVILLAKDEFQQCMNMRQFKFQSLLFKEYVASATHLLKACLQTAAQWNSLKLGCKKAHDTQVAIQKKELKQSEAKQAASEKKLQRAEKASAAVTGISKNDYAVLAGLHSAPADRLIKTTAASTSWCAP